VVRAGVGFSCAAGMPPVPNYAPGEEDDSSVINVEVDYIFWLGLGNKFCLGWKGVLIPSG